MKVLLSSVRNPAFEALPDYLEAALARCGHAVIRFDHRRFLLPGRLRQRSAWLQRLDLARLNAAFLRLARRTLPDVVIVNQGMTLAPETIRAVRREGIRCVNWFADYPAEFEAGLKAAPAYDAFHLASSYAVRRHHAAGIASAAWLPFGCDPEAHRPSPRNESLAPKGSERNGADSPRVVLVGSHYPERQILLRFLRGLPVDIFGPGWERAKGDPDIAPMLRGGALRPSEWSRVYSRAAAVLNIHYGAFGPRAVSGDMANTRVYEILACGALQIVDRQADVLHLFRENVHLLAFSSGDELRARVEQALADRERAGAIAAAGQREVLAFHTYDHRLPALLGERPPLALPEAAGRAA